MHQILHETREMHAWIKEKLKEKQLSYVNAARDVVKFDKAVLFGSYANGKPEEYSDIDIGLFMDRLDENVDYLKLMSSLYPCSGGYRHIDRTSPFHPW